MTLGSIKIIWRVPPNFPKGALGIVESPFRGRYSPSPKRLHIHYTHRQKTSQVATATGQFPHPEDPHLPAPAL